MGISESSSPHQPPDPPPPRMSIAHLMLLTLATAVCISLMNFVAAQWNTFVSPSAPDPMMDMLRIAARLWHAGILGAELALAGIVLTWLVQRRPQNIAPGHWLLVGLGVDAVLSIFLNTLSALFITSDVPYLDGYARLCVFGMSELLMAAVWFGLAGQTFQGAWRLVPVLQGVLNVITAAGWLLMAFGMHDSSSPGGLLSAALLVAIGGLGLFVPGLAAIVLAIHDRVEERPRDWLHVLGAALIALQIVIAVLYRLIPPV